MRFGQEHMGSREGLLDRLKRLGGGRMHGGGKQTIVSHEGAVYQPAPAYEKRPEPTACIANRLPNPVDLGMMSTLSVLKESV